MVDRRTILKALTALPILAVAGGVGTALLSYLRPTLRPLEFPTAEEPLNKDLVAATHEEFPNVYDFKEFTFVQQTVEYTARGKQETNIPGYIVRIPNDRIPETVGQIAGPNRLGYAIANYNGETYSMVAVSRICAHLGCIFQYTTPEETCEGYNFCAAETNMFACPCHLSVYDPAQAGDANGTLLPGLVVSGPAPRPTFPFTFEVTGQGQVVIKAYS